jgi:hypothetical protein
MQTKNIVTVLIILFFEMLNFIIKYLQYVYIYIYIYIYKAY